MPEISGIGENFIRHFIISIVSLVAAFSVPQKLKMHEVADAAKAEKAAKEEPKEEPKEEAKEEAKEEVKEEGKEEVKEEGKEEATKVEDEVDDNAPEVEVRPTDGHKFQFRMTCQSWICQGHSKKFSRALNM